MGDREARKFLVAWQKGSASNDDAVDWAEQQPYPKAEDVTKDVYDEG